MFYYIKRSLILWFLTTTTIGTPLEMPSVKPTQSMAMPIPVKAPLYIPGLPTITTPSLTPISYVSPSSSSVNLNESTINDYLDNIYTNSKIGIVFKQIIDEMLDNNTCSHTNNAQTILHIITEHPHKLLDIMVSFSKKIILDNDTVKQIKTHFEDKVIHQIVLFLSKNHSKNLIVQIINDIGANGIYTQMFVNTAKIMGANEFIIQIILETTREFYLDWNNVSSV